MARNKKLQANIDNSDPVNFPDGRIRDNTGAGDGTPVNEIVYGDIHEFFAKLMRLYSITFNGVPDNVANGYQLLDAVRALASKNDFLLTISTDGVLIVPLKLNLVTEGEAFTCIAQSDQAAETQIKGSLDPVPILKNVIFKGGNFKTGEYIRLVVTAIGVDLVRLSDGDALDTIAGDFGFLKAANQTEEDAGAINTVATTPLTNFTAFADRVNGVASVNFLATAIINGLMSAADKAKLDAVGSIEKNYGKVQGIDVDTGSVSDFYSVTGDITQAQLTTRTTEGQVITVTFANAMDDTNYEIITNVESKGGIIQDNDIRAVVYKIINTTQIQIILDEYVNTTQNIDVHITAKQR